MKTKIIFFVITIGLFASCSKDNKYLNSEKSQFKNGPNEFKAIEQPSKQCVLGAR